MAHCKPANRLIASHRRNEGSPASLMPTLRMRHHCGDQDGQVPQGECSVGSDACRSLFDGAIGLDDAEMTRGLMATMKAVFSNLRTIRQPTRSEITGRQSRNFLPKSKGCLFEMDYAFSL